MDGVLIQSRQVIEQAWISVASVYGVEITDASVHECIHGRPGSYTLTALFGRFPARQRQRIKQQVDAMEETADCALLPGLSELLQALKQAGLPLALVTSSWPARIDYVLRQHDLCASFDAIVHREDVVEGKPDPACYLLAAKRLGVDIKECLAFEDSTSGVKAAVEGGALCIGIGDDAALMSCGASQLHRDFRSLLPRASDTLSHYVDLRAPTRPLLLAKTSGAA